jgi:MFS family permease
MSRSRVEFAFLNLAHFYDHFLLLVFASASALTLAQDMGMGYGELIPYATPGFIAFAAFSIPAGWIADKWSRKGMLVIFFIGIGASAALTALADTPMEIAIGLFAIGVFAAIYHPVGLAMVVQGRTRTGMPIAVNGVFGNLGVASAALATGAFIDYASWRWAFILPGIVSILTGFAYAAFVASGRRQGAAAAGGAGGGRVVTIGAPGIEQRQLIRLFGIVFFSTAVGGLIFQSTTFALPKVFDERLGTLAETATLVGWYAFIVFTIGAFAQLAVGYLVDRHSVRTVFVFVAAAQMILFAVMYKLTGVAALIVSIGFMLVVFGQLPINDVLVARVTRSEWRSRVYALRYITTFSVSASALPLIGWIHQDWGFATLFVILAAAAALILASVFQLPRSASAIIPAPAE